MSVRPNLNQFETNTEQLLNYMMIVTITIFLIIIKFIKAHNTTGSHINANQLPYVVKASGMQTIPLIR